MAGDPSAAVGLLDFCKNPEHPAAHTEVPVKIFFNFPKALNYGFKNLTPGTVFVCVKDLVTSIINCTKKIYSFFAFFFASE